MSRLENAHWSSCTPSAPLRRWKLLRALREGEWLEGPLRLEEQVLHYLKGTPELEPSLEQRSVAVTAPQYPTRGVVSTVRGLLRRWLNTDVSSFLGTFSLKFNVAIRFGEKGVVFTTADVNARVYASTPLADDDVASQD